MTSTVLQIPVIADLPVGDNLQDHLMTLLRVLIDKPLSTSPQMINKPWSLWQYDLLRTGIMRSRQFVSILMNWRFGFGFKARKRFYIIYLFI